MPCTFIHVHLFEKPGSKLGLAISNTILDLYCKLKFINITC